MTFNQILDKVAYGDEYVQFKAIKEGIEENYDKENDIFKASGRIRDLVESLDLKDSERRIFNHIASKCETVEQRLFNEDSMSNNYKKLMGMSIAEDCNTIINLSNKRGTCEAFASKENFARAIATAKYFVESYLTDDNFIKESKNVSFNKIINEDEENIKQVL